ncbi:hypothetical protein ABPG75_005824 [Micractinium tetrahymenae]
MSASLDAGREAYIADSVSLREAAAARIKAGSPATASAGSGSVEVVVSAGTPISPALAADRQYSTGEDSRPATGFTEGSKISFLKRASRRIRRSIYSYGAPGPAHESYYRDSMLVPDPAMAEAARSASKCGIVLRRRLWPQHWQQAVCRFIDSLPWSIFILLITIFAVFAPDIAILVSAPDYVNNWINGLLLGIMGIFAAETLAYVTCRESVLWLQVGLDIVSNLSILFAVTWFAEAVGIRSDGTTSDAARACRILRLVRVASVAEHLGWRARQWYLNRQSAGAAGPARDRLEPSNIGKKIAEVTTLQVSLVVIGTVVGTSLLIGADLNTGGSEGLDAFASALAAAAAAGASAAELNATVDAMVAFSYDQLASKQVPMELTVYSAGGALNWDWVQQHGGWTRRSTDRQGMLSEVPQVSLSVSLAHANHLRARYNMLLAAMVVVLLLGFVVLLNWTIWKMLVQPLDRIFNTIRTNAAQVVAALGPEVGRKGGEAAGDPGGGSRGSRKDDLDMHTIEAAVEKMSRILEQYTSTGGVGINTVKKMATNADQSTKEWLATMVAGPASEEVANTGPSGTGGSPGSKPSSVGRLPRRSGACTPSAGRPGPPQRPRQSRLGRMSEAKLAAGQQAGQQPWPGGQAKLHGSSHEKLRRSSLNQFLERCSTNGSADSAHATGSLRPVALASPPQPALASSGGAAAGGTLAVAPSAPSAASVESDSVAVVALAAALAGHNAPRSPAAGGDPWAGASGSSLSEAQKALLGQVDLDYLHSFSFDALGVPPPLLPAYVCAMFLELDLAFFSGADSDPDEAEGPGFVDVITLWRFADEVSTIYQSVPYHNFQHCVDVTHTTFMFIKRVGHKVALTGLERFALMAAAISHDLDHPGLNNAFLVNMRDPLATTYNDNSVLENRHIACLYSLLLSKPHLNIFARLDAAQWKEVRKSVIGAILATDMVHHFPMVSRLEVFYELHAANIQAHHRALRQGMPRDGLPRLFDAAEERQLLLNLLLHCADISNPVKPTEIAEKWSERVLGEFFAQGDRERAAGMPISPMCDRARTSRAGSQINFIEFVVAPIYAQAYKIFPELGEAVDNLMANRHFWQDELMGELAAPGAVVPGTLDPLTPERRAEEQAKAEQRLRDFQAKYRDILSRRRHQLERLVAASRGSLLLRQHNFDSGGAHRHSSLQLLVEQSGPSGGSSAGGDRRRSQGGGLLGRLARLTHGHSPRGPGSLSGSAAGSSGRASNASSTASDAAQAVAELQAQLQRPESGSSGAGGPRFLSGSSNRVVPLDAV